MKEARTRRVVRSGLVALSVLRALGRAPRWLLPLGATALMLVSAPATAEDRDLKAREAFAAGRYQEALDIYAKLFAETLHPTYLRNVGRCHQMLGNPDQAINSFREYLRRAPDLSAHQRAEVEGFIADMEALRKTRAAQAAAAADAARASTVQTVAPAPKAGSNVEALVVSSGPQSEPPSEGARAAATRLGHGGQLGVLLRTDTAVTPEVGLVVAPGLCYGLSDHLEIAAGGLVGYYKGGWLEGRFLLAAAGSWKPFASLDLPVFSVDGKLKPGIQPGVGLQWDAGQHLGVFAALTASLFPNAGAELHQFWLVPTLGLQVRL